MTNRKKVHASRIQTGMTHRETGTGTRDTNRHDSYRSGHRQAGCKQA